MADDMGPLSAAVRDFVSSKSLEDLTKLRTLTETGIETQRASVIKALRSSSLFDFVDSTFQGLSGELQCELASFFISLQNMLQVYDGFTEKSLIVLIECAKSNDIKVQHKCLELLTEITSSRTKFDDATLEEIIKNLTEFFHRKVAKDVVIAATSLLATLIKVLPLDKLQWTEGPLRYTLNHICEEILVESFKAVINLSKKGCDCINYIVDMKYHDMVYAQIRYPSVNIKKAIFQLFTNIAACCGEHRLLVRSHDMKNRLPVFLCHYNDDVCMQCIEMLDALQFPVQQLIDEKYVITLILHVAMSSTSFKDRCFAVLRKMFEESNEKQVQELIDNGFIRPFCSLLHESNDEQCKAILNILLKVIEVHNGLDSKLCRFDFDHAHGSDNKSCVDQINAMKTRSDAEVVFTAEKILQYLSSREIIMHAANDE